MIHKKSQAIKANGFVFVSGQMPATFEDGKIRLTEGTVADKTHALCRNAGIVLEAAGSSLDKVVKVTVSPDISRVWPSVHTYAQVHQCIFKF